MKVSRWMLMATAVAALAAGLLAVWFLRAPRVPAVALAEAPLVRTLQFSARVATASRVDLGSTITGRVLRVEVAEGERVRQGQVLVRLESDELKAALAQALASERQAAARLGGLRSTGRSSAQAAWAQTESVLVAAQAELQRTQDLVAKGFLSPARLDEAQRAVAVARAQQAGALAQRTANAEQGTDVAQAQAQLALAAAATAAARARLEQAVLTAPADAQVLARAVEPGQIVQPGRALLTLALAGSPQLSAQVDERFLQQLQVGQRASVMADAFPGQRFEAKVASIAPLVDAQRGAIEVKFSLPPALQQSPPPFLREDMTLSVEVETARRDNALVLPMAALRSEPGAAQGTVWIERNGRVEARPVRLGLRTLDAAEVLEGLAAGDAVLMGDAPPPGRRVHADVGASAALAAKRASQDAGSAMTNAMGR
jgi:HlyD family secretion protein